MEAIDAASNFAMSVGAITVLIYFIVRLWP
jgi:hypothetical protein